MHHNVEAGLVVVPPTSTICIPILSYHVAHRLPGLKGWRTYWCDFSNKYPATLDARIGPSKSLIVVVTSTSPLYMMIISIIVERKSSARKPAVRSLTLHIFADGSSGRSNFSWPVFCTRRLVVTTNNWSHLFVEALYKPYRVHRFSICTPSFVPKVPTCFQLGLNPQSQLTVEYVLSDFPVMPSYNSRSMQYYNSFLFHYFYALFMTKIAAFKRLLKKEMADGGRVGTRNIQNKPQDARGLINVNFECKRIHVTANCRSLFLQQVVLTANHLS